VLNPRRDSSRKEQDDEEGRLTRLYWNLFAPSSYIHNPFLKGDDTPLLFSFFLFFKTESAAGLDWAKTLLDFSAED